jgi:hypothetical protein
MKKFLSKDKKLSKKRAHLKLLYRRKPSKTEQMYIFFKANFSFLPRKHKLLKIQVEQGIELFYGNLQMLSLIIFTFVS